MRLPCYYRAGAKGIIVQGTFTIETGLLDGVPPELFFFDAPIEFRQLFTENVTDPLFKLSLKEACIDMLYQIPYVMCVFAGDGAFIYGLQDKSIIMQSTADPSNHKLISCDKPPVMFPEPHGYAGFLRQKALSFNVPLREKQFVNVFTLNNGKRVYFTEKGMKEVNFQFDSPPNYGLINYVQFVKNPDPEIIGVGTLNGTLMYIRK